MQPFPAGFFLVLVPQTLLCGAGSSCGTLCSNSTLRDAHAVLRYHALGPFALIWAGMLEVFLHPLLGSTTLGMGLAMELGGRGRCGFHELRGSRWAWAGHGTGSCEPRAERPHS